MKKLMIVLASMAAFASCKKEKAVTAPDAAPLPAGGKTIITNYISPFGNQVETVNFNSAGKVINSRELIQSINVTRDRSFDYSTIGKIIVQEKDNGVLKFTYNSDVNLKGNVVEMNVYKADGSLDENWKYSYDANDYVVKIVKTDNAGNVQTTDQKILNGNVIERKVFNGSTLFRTAIFTYDLSRINKLEYALAGEWQGASFGKSNTNLLTNYKEFLSSGGLFKNEDRVYVLNTDGTVQKFTAFDNVANSTYEKKYTYQ